MTGHEQVMPKVDGKSFRCPDCGCNVFSKLGVRGGDILYRCNGCGGRWAGTPGKKP